MKTQFLALFFLLSSYLTVKSQNFLPYEWKIIQSITDEKKTNSESKNSEKKVNLLLSWERQGYFWHDGNCCLLSDFIIPSTYKDSTFVLSLSLQCNVEKIQINGVYIGGNLPNQFWTNRGERTNFTIPKQVLKFNQTNKIEIFVNNLSYTGGISHNYCSLSPQKNTKKSEIDLQIPKQNHVFTDKEISIKIKYKIPKNGNLKLEIKNDFHELILNKNIKLLAKDSFILVDLSKELERAGFYECTGVINSIGYIGDVEWIAVSPENIDCKTDTINGFSNYWKEALKELELIPPDFKIHKTDSLCSVTRDGYILEMKSIGGITIRGYYFVPKTAGKHPALLHLPGYGWGYQNIDQFLKNTENVAELALCVRGHGISADVFNPGFGIPSIWGYMLHSKQDMAYRAIYMDCVRAVDFLRSREEIDSTKIGVLGGSQGGGLALATSGLCGNKVAACAYCDPFPCDTRDFINIRQLCQTELKLFLDFYKNPCTFDKALDIQDFINTKNFAYWIKCPTLYSTLLFDDDCPPHIGFATYNLINAPKQYIVYPYDSHLGESNFGKGFMDFFKKQFKF